MDDRVYYRLGRHRHLVLLVGQPVFVRGPRVDETLALRVKCNVVSDLPFSRTGVRSGSVFVGDQIEINPHGAVSVPANDGKLLGLRPAEWEWIDAAEVAGG